MARPVVIDFFLNESLKGVRCLFILTRGREVVLLHLISVVVAVGLANKSVFDCNRGYETLGVVEEQLPFRQAIIDGLVCLLIIVVLEGEADLARGRLEAADGSA